MIIYNCPKCRGGLENPRSMAGKEDKCPSCGHVHLVPPAPKRGKAAIIACLCAGLLLVGGVILFLVLHRGHETKESKMPAGFASPDALLKAYTDAIASSDSAAWYALHQAKETGAVMTLFFVKDGIRYSAVPGDIPGEQDRAKLFADLMKEFRDLDPARAPAQQRSPDYANAIWWVRDKASVAKRHTVGWAFELRRDESGWRIAKMYQLERE